MISDIDIVFGSTKIYNLAKFFHFQGTIKARDSMPDVDHKVLPNATVLSGTHLVLKITRL